MYAGTTLTPLSGRIMGAHQKIDRLARATLKELLSDNTVFPGNRAILHFEGLNGPDGIKRKSPAKDEPWHFIEPFNEADTQLIDQISGHYDSLVKALKANDDVRSAFEAAWLAHAIVDGLTPAHHYPYEEKLSELREGASMATRDTMRHRLVMPGETRGRQMRNNWRMWGIGGLMTTHGFFEFGVAALLVHVSHRALAIGPEQIATLREHHVIGLFRRTAREIAGRRMYDQYASFGWTPKLAKIVRHTLIPSVVQTVALTWYAALIDAGLAELPA